MIFSSPIMTVIIKMIYHNDDGYDEHLLNDDHRKDMMGSEFNWFQKYKMFGNLFLYLFFCCWFNMWRPSMHVVIFGFIS